MSFEATLVKLRRLAAQELPQSSTSTVHKLDLEAVLDEVTQLAKEMEWLDQHCSFVADGRYCLGPFKRGELRKLAQAGLKADATGEGLIPGYVE